MFLDCGELAHQCAGALAVRELRSAHKRLPAFSKAAGTRTKEENMTQERNSQNQNSQNQNSQNQNSQNQNSRKQQTSPAGEFARYVSMNILSMIGMSIYILADTYFISLGIGTTGLAALNLALPIYNLVNGVGLLLGIGGAARFIISRTQNRMDESRRVFSTAVIAGMVFSAVCVLTAVFFGDQIAAALGADDATFANTAIYLKVILIFSPAFVLNNILTAFVRNDGNPRLSMMGMLAGSLFNTVFDYVFIFLLGLGMFGAVLATGFSPVVGILVLLIHVCRTKTFSFDFKGFSRRTLARVAAGGVPSFVNEMASGIVMLVFNYRILGIAGNDGVAAYGVLANILIVILAVYNGLAQGSQPVFGKVYARADEAAMRKVFRYAVITEAVISALFYFITFGFREQLTAIFNSERNENLTRLAAAGFPLYFIQCLPLGLNILLIMYFIAVERAGFAQVLSLLRGVLIVIPLAVILSAAFGMAGIWLAMPLTECAVFFIAVLDFHRKRSTVSQGE